MALAPYPWLEEPAQTLLAMRDRMPNAVLLYGTSLKYPIYILKQLKKIYNHCFNDYNKIE